VKFVLFALVVAIIIWAVRRTKFGAPVMSVAEAAQTLEISINADADAISAAHRRLIGKVHPDMGGSAALAARVNQARDVMLRRLTR
jgi:DnaJ homolog subfamily C member 19